MTDAKQAHKQEKVGEVVSTKMKKTIVVEITRRASHSLYHRTVTRTKKFYAHDEKETAKLGDIVRIIESRPISRLKRWRLAEVIRHSAVVGAPSLPDPEILAPAAQPVKEVQP
jgi:small subunit ribosomal protein S17